MYSKATICLFGWEAYHECYCSAQEGIHNIKTRKLKSMVMNLDLIKVYNKINWLFLSLVLLQIGLCMEAVNWIMGCLLLLIMLY